MQWVDSAPTQLRDAASIDLRSGDAVIVLDSAGTCIGAEDGLQGLFGFDVEHLLGRSRVDARWHWCDAEGQPVGEAENPVAVALASGRPGALAAVPSAQILEFLGIQTRARALGVGQHPFGLGRNAEFEVEVL